MIYESAESVPVTQDFTLAEYQRQELSKQDSFEARAVDFLQLVRREMATGRFDNTSQLRDRPAGADPRSAGVADRNRPATDHPVVRATRRAPAGSPGSFSAGLVSSSSGSARPWPCASARPGAKLHSLPRVWTPIH